MQGWVLRDSWLLFERAPRWPMIAVSNAVRGSVLWMAMCAGLALRSGVTRRAAVRGTTALAASSAASHVLGKVLVERARPNAAHLAVRRALSEQPSSSSFPSAHATCAVAFTTAIGLESPVLGLVVTPMAAVVAYARVRTRVHWPTDVAAGAVLGATTAVLTRWIPMGGRVARLPTRQPTGPGRRVERGRSASAA